MSRYQIQIGSEWKDFATDEDRLLKHYFKEQGTFKVTLRGQPYEFDFATMEQRNLSTGRVRKIRPPQKGAPARPGLASIAPSFEPGSAAVSPVHPLPTPIATIVVQPPSSRTELPAEAGSHPSPVIAPVQTLAPTAKVAAALPEVPFCTVLVPPPAVPPAGGLSKPALRGSEEAATELPCSTLPLHTLAVPLGIGSRTGLAAETRIRSPSPVLPALPEELEEGVDEEGRQWLIGHLQADTILVQKPSSPVKGVEEDFLAEGQDDLLKWMIGHVQELQEENPPAVGSPTCAGGGA